jgi:hypothetical protein
VSGCLAGHQINLVGPAIAIDDLFGDSRNVCALDWFAEELAMASKQTREE